MKRIILNISVGFLDKELPEAVEKLISSNP